MELNSRTEVKLYKEKYTWISSHGWRLVVSTVVSVGKVVIFSVKHIVHGAWFNLLGKCFGRQLRVWWQHIYFMKLSEGWSKRQCMSYQEIGFLFKELLIIGVISRVMMSWYEYFCCSILLTPISLVVGLFIWMLFQLLSYFLYLCRFVTILEP